MICCFECSLGRTEGRRAGGDCSSLGTLNSIPGSPILYISRIIVVPTDPPFAASMPKSRNHNGFGCSWLDGLIYNYLHLQRTREYLYLPSHRQQCQVSIKYNKRRIWIRVDIGNQNKLNGILPRSPTVVSFVLLLCLFYFPWGMWQFLGVHSIKGMSIYIKVVYIPPKSEGFQ